VPITLVVLAGSRRKSGRWCASFC